MSPVTPKYADVDCVESLCKLVGLFDSGWRWPLLQSVTASGCSKKLELTSTTEKHSEARCLICRYVNSSSAGLIYISLVLPPA